MEPEYLRSCSKGMVESIKEGDPEGVWLMETWVFINGYVWKDENIPDFWSEVILNGRCSGLPGRYRERRGLHSARPDERRRTFSGS